RRPRPAAIHERAGRRRGGALRLVPRRRRGRRVPRLRRPEARRQLPRAVTRWRGRHREDGGRPPPRRVHLATIRRRHLPPRLPPRLAARLTQLTNPTTAPT